MELIALKLFCDVMDTRSFSRAADRNFMSQSAVSQRLRSLESDLGQVLLERGKGKSKITPTEAGLLLYAGAKQLLHDMAELEAQVRSLSDEVAGIVRVATVYSVGLHALPRRLKPFLGKHPRVSVYLEYSQTGKVYQDVLSGTVDVGIVAVPTPRAGIEIFPFDEEPIALICAPEHPLARETTVRLAQLEGLPFIAFTEGIPTRRLIDEHLREAGVTVKVVMTFENIETIKNLVEIGSGVSLLPEETARKEVREGTLAIVPLAAEDAFLRPTGLLLKQSGVRRAAVRAYVEAMRIVR
jgi:DNA-binding transcriptional LysR family regulator